MLCILSQSTVWLYLFLVVHLSDLGYAWSLADDCTGDNAAKVQEAMPNAIAMADYASKRADPNSQYQRKGTLLQDLLGASSEDDPDALALAQRMDFQTPLRIL